MNRMMEYNANTSEKMSSINDGVSGKTSDISATGDFDCTETCSSSFDHLDGVRLIVERDHIEQEQEQEEQDDKEDAVEPLPSFEPSTTSLTMNMDDDPSVGASVDHSQDKTASNNTSTRQGENGPVQQSGEIQNGDNALMEKEENEGVGNGQEGEEQEEKMKRQQTASIRQIAQDRENTKMVGGKGDDDDDEEEEEEEKHQRRLAQNRKTAQLRRDRGRLYLERLQLEKRRLKEENISLQEERKALKHHHSVISSLLKKSEDHVAQRGQGLLAPSTSTSPAGVVPLRQPHTPALSPFAFGNQQQIFQQDPLGLMGPQHHLQASTNPQTSPFFHQPQPHLLLQEHLSRRHPSITTNPPQNLNNPICPPFNNSHGHPFIPPAMNAGFGAGVLPSIFPPAGMENNNQQEITPQSVHDNYLRSLIQTQERALKRSKREYSGTGHDPNGRTQQDAFHFQQRQQGEHKEEQGLEQPKLMNALASVLPLFRVNSGDINAYVAAAASSEASSSQRNSSSSRHTGQPQMEDETERTQDGQTFQELSLLLQQNQDKEDKAEFSSEANGRRNSR